MESEFMLKSEQINGSIVSKQMAKKSMEDSAYLKKVNENEILNAKSIPIYKLKDATAK